MNDTDKLRILLPHWVEHNGEHAAEFRKWAAKVAPPVQDKVIAAAELMDQASARLQEALELLAA